MMAPRELHEELLEIADRLERIWERAAEPDIKPRLDRLEEAATQIGKAWSGSCIGYHSRIYYKGLVPPPPGAHFSPEWGMMNSYPIRDTTGDWQEFDPARVETAIRRLAQNPELEPARQLAASAERAVENTKPDLLSVLTTTLAEQQDGFLTSLRDEVETTTVLSQSQVTRRWLPSGQIMSRDSLAMTQGLQVPPHVSVLAEVVALRQEPDACGRLAQVARKAGSHLARRRRRSRRSQEVGTNIFIGHGRSPIWRELKDFVEGRLRLPWDEFNRVPVAGVTNVARLSEMLDAAAIAFLIMTGEDVQADGALHARLNVVHEAGLFQGRLGFTRAIVLLEEGCEGFSNIDGLGQIRYPRGNIKAAFEEVRRVLERENILGGA
jgi:predicted nucleotide-binding protein